jgi:hypothetical protein
MTPFGPRPALLTVFFVSGDPPLSVEEGINAAIPSVGDFNRQTGGMNVYIHSSLLGARTRTIRGRPNVELARPSTSLDEPTGVRLRARL